jgi:hypothetical protein
MTRVFNQPQPHGGTRLIVLGASAYPNAQETRTRVPRLTPISSAAKSAIDLATRALGPWQNRFPKPLASVDILVDTPETPNGALFSAPDGTLFLVAPPTMANIKVARRDAMADANPNDILIFYCCGHGIWLPAVGRTFLTAGHGHTGRRWLHANAADVPQARRRGRGRD